MKAFFQLYLANVKEFVRDRMAMFWTLAFPVFFIVLFGVVFSGDTSTTFDVGVAVEDQGSLGAALGKVFGKVDAFKVTEGTRDELLDKLKKGDLRVVIVVPDGLSTAVTSGQTANVEAYYDPANQTTAQVVLAIVEKVVEGFASTSRSPSAPPCSPSSPSRWRPSSCGISTSCCRASSAWR